VFQRQRKTEQSDRRLQRKEKSDHRLAVNASLTVDPITRRSNDHQRPSDHLVLETLLLLVDQTCLAATLAVVI
jgi:hypothetical protein